MNKREDLFEEEEVQSKSKKLRLRIQREKEKKYSKQSLLEELNDGYIPPDQELDRKT